MRAERDDRGTPDTYQGSSSAVLQLYMFHIYGSYQGSSSGVLQLYMFHIYGSCLTKRMCHLCSTLDVTLVKSSVVSVYVL